MRMDRPPGGGTVAGFAAHNTSLIGRAHRTMGPLLLLILLFVIAWVVLILPKQRELKRHDALVASLEVGDEVMTGSGFYGTLTEVTDDTVLVAAGPRHRGQARPPGRGRQGRRPRRGHRRRRRRTRRHATNADTPDRPQTPPTLTQTRTWTGEALPWVLVADHHRGGGRTGPHLHARGGQQAAARPRPPGRCVGRAAAKGRDRQRHHQRGHRHHPPARRRPRRGRAGDHRPGRLQRFPSSRSPG